MTVSGYCFLYDKQYTPRKDFKITKNYVNSPLTKFIETGLPDEVVYIIEKPKNDSTRQTVNHSSH